MKDARRSATRFYSIRPGSLHARLLQNGDTLLTVNGVDHVGGPRHSRRHEDPRGERALRLIEPAGPAAR